MVGQVTVNIFLDSPDDLNEEKKVLDKVINEMNWENENIQLKLVKWEIDKSEIITKNYSLDCVLFICIIWKQVSKLKIRNLETTPNFNNIIKGFKYNSEITPMFYFSNVPIRPKDIDVKEITLINEFKAELNNNGILYWEYDKVEDFYHLIKMHLTKKIHKQLKSMQTKNKFKILYDFEKDSDYKFSDLIVISQNNFELLKGVLEHISVSTQSFAENVNKRGYEFNQIQSDEPDLELARTIIKKIVLEMEQFVKNIKNDIPTFSMIFYEGNDALLLASDLVKDNPENYEQILGTLFLFENMQNEIIILSESIEEFRNAISNLPSLTKEMNYTKRKTLRTLEELINELLNAKEIALVTERYMNKNFYSKDLNRNHLYHR